MRSARMDSISPTGRRSVLILAEKSRNVASSSSGRRAASRQQPVLHCVVAHLRFARRCRWARSSASTFSRLALICLAVAIFLYRLRSSYSLLGAECGLLKAVV